MNSKNILKLLAVLLILANIVLLIMVLSAYKEKYYIDDSYIENTYSIFNNEGIEIESGAIPNEKFSGNIYSAATDEDYYETVAKNITGETISTRFLMPGGFALTTEKGKSLEFSEDYYFKYSFSETETVPLSPFSAETVSYGMKNKLFDLASEFLSAKDEGLYPSDAEILNVSYDQPSELYYIMLAQTVNGVALHGHELLLVIDKEGSVRYAEGKWCFFYNTERYSSQIYDQVNILFIDKASRAEENAPGIIRVAPYYIIYSNEEDSSVLLVPAWRIDYSDGTYKLYDAENGSAAQTSD